jgi:DNA-binding GntR family transcriptional regulator
MPEGCAMLKLPKYPNLTELSYLNVRQHILDGSLGEGAKLTEETLANQLGISKSPIREALNRLESEGLICIEPRRGAYVRKFTLKEACDLYGLREVLEVYAVSLAKITPQFLNDLAESIERIRQNLDKSDMIAHVEEDIRFHGRIAAATANKELCSIIENLNQKSILCRAKTYRLSVASSLDNHSRIYNAFKEGNRELAQQIMHDHIHFVHKVLLGLMHAEESNATPEEGIDPIASAASS